MVEKEKLKRFKGFGKVIVRKKDFQPTLAVWHWWRNQALEIVWIAGLLILNILHLRPLFSQQFSYILSAPLIPFWSDLIAKLGLGSAAQIEKSIILILVLISPLFFYFFIKELTNRFLPAVMAALLFSTPLFQARLTAILINDDAAHIASLTLAPLVSYLVLRFLRKGVFSQALAASLVMAATALVSPFGLFVSGVFLLIIVFSEMLLSQARLKLARLVTVLLLAAGWSAFWYHPGFIHSIIVSQHGQEMIATLSNLLPLSFFLIPVLGVLGFLVFVKKSFLQPLFIALGLSLTFFLISFAGRLGSGFLISYPDRYRPELNFSLCFLIGIIITLIFDFLRQSEKIKVLKIKPEQKDKLAIGFLGLVFLVLLILAWPRGQTQAFLKTLPQSTIGLNDNGKGEIWQIKEQASLWESLLGYSLTFLTLVFSIFLQRRMNHDRTA